MTRRVVKPVNNKIHCVDAERIWELHTPTEIKVLGVSRFRAGDILWVREMWHCIGVGHAGNQDTAHIEYADETCKIMDITPDKAVYYAGKARWRSPIFMPREAARLFLKVESVRVERLHDITEADAQKEGVEKMPLFDLKQIPQQLFIPGGKYGKGMIPNASYKAGFYKIWEELNAKRGYGWDVNPWVWVIGFRRIEK
jgi:hypothetical protein